MGLSIAISGGIVTFAIVYAMMSFPAILDDTAKVSMSSSQMSSTLNSIVHTNINATSLLNTSNSDQVNFKIKNIGNTILWNYNKFDVIITYQSNGIGNPTLTEVLQYSNNCNSLASDHWCIVNITNDLIRPGLLDPGETLNIQAKLLDQTNSNSKLNLNFGTDNGVLSPISVTIT